MSSSQPSNLAGAARAPGGDPVDADLAAELADGLHVLGRRLRRSTASEFGALGVTGAQARVLRLLARRGPMRMSEVAHALDVVPRSVTTVVDGLEAAGFAERRPDPGDRRVTLVATTPRGRKVLARLRSSRRAAAADLVGRLPATDQQELLRMLAVLIGHPDPDPGPDPDPDPGAKPDRA